MPTRMPSIATGGRANRSLMAAASARATGRGSAFLPRVVAPEPPQVPFRVAAGIAAPAVRLVGDVDHDPRAGGRGLRIMRIDIGDDHAGALGLAHADLVGL